MSSTSPVASEEVSSDETVIVGIGASAGGIEALTAFFKEVQPDSGMAYVVILHLSPDFDSQLAEILQNVSSIPVMKVTEQVKIAADHAYVVPPNKHLRMEDGVIVLLSNTHINERRAPIDIFFRTLAKTHGPRAVAVILSGTGANGSMGIKRIKENGGGVFVQNPTEAAFGEMPRQAIATELVDEVLPVARIPAQLLAYRQRLGTLVIPVDSQERPEDQQQALREVFTQLRLRTGHDFSNYKRPTLLRRLARRIHVRDLPDLPAYVHYLREHPEEIQALLKDLLISVTNFFRDTRVYNALEQEVIPALIAAKKPGEPLRIWVAGCATGEEAYSLAMLLAEQTLASLDSPDVQIFATDIDGDAIATAREGLYTLNDAADVSPERLRRFFTKEGEAYRIRREIREMILFASHNVLKDPPFSRLDLVSCRNLLIYLNQTAQERILETFHFALNPGGYLLLGQSETVDSSKDLYSTLSREHHLYQGRQVVSRPYPIPEGIPLFTAERKRPSETAAESEPRSPQRLSYGELHQQLLELYAPPSIIVNEEYDILHLSERAGRYLQIVGGEPTKSLLKLIRPELRLELRTAFIQATQRQSNVEVRNLPLRIEDQTETLNLHVRPVLREGDPARGFILVLFEPVSEDTAQSSRVISSVEPAARHLEEELVRVKEQLRASNEHHELQAEELKASNEELQAMNEELRSAAEELETSKEELQSINEELITVNQELKVKVEEVSITSNNLQNLINATDIATLFLDRSLRVRLFTPSVNQLFNLISSDLGRPLTDITNRLTYPDLAADAERVLETLLPIERELQTTDNRTFILRVLPYRTTDDHINGLVITLVDITERKAAAETLRLSEQRQRFLLGLSDLLRKYTHKPDILRTAFQQLAEQLPADRINYAEVDGETYIVVEEYRGTGLGSSVSLGPPERAAFEAGHSVVIADIEAAADLSPAEAAAYAGLGVRALASVPLLREGRLAAVLSVFRSQPGEWKLHEVSLIEETAQRTCLAVERARAETMLQQSDERKTFLLQLSDNLRPLGHSSTIQATVTRMARQHFGADRCYYCEIETEKAIIRQDDFRPGLPSVAGEYPLSSFPLLQAVIDGGRPFIVPDVHTTDLVDEPLRQLCIQLQVISFIDVPVVKNGHPVGVLCITQCSPRDWARFDVELAEEIAERTWAAVEHARAEEALGASRKRFESIANLVPDLLWESGPDGSTNWLNRRWLDYTGQPFEEAIGWGWAEAIHPEDRKASAQRYGEAVAAGTALRQEHRIRRHDGEYHWFVVHALPHKDESGKVIKMHGAATDIHESRLMHEVLRESEERLRIAIEAAEMATWDWNLQTDEIKWNERHFTLLGMEPTEKPQHPRSFFAQVHPEDQKQVGEKLEKAIETNTVFEAEFRIIQKDTGKIRWMEGYGNITGWEDDQPTRMSGVMSDVSQRKCAEGALRLSEEKYRTLFESMDEGFCIVEVLFDANGKAVDYRFLEANPAFEQHTGLTGAMGKTVRELVPEHEAFWFETYGRIARTGQPERFENEARALGYFYDVYAFRIGAPDENRVAVLFKDISHQKQREEDAAFLADLNEDMGQAATLELLMQQVGEKLYDYYHLSRVSFAYVNERATVTTVVYDRHEPTLPDALGDHSLVAFLGDHIRQVMREARTVVVNDITTDPQRAASAEIYQSYGTRAQLVAPYVSGGQWRFLISLQKSEPFNWQTHQVDFLENLVPRLYLALERRRFEQLRQLILLQQTEEVAKIGSWEYDRHTGQFSWSDGMYKLFGMETGQPVQPDIYLRFAVGDDQPKAQDLINYIQTGSEPLALDLRIRVGETVKTIRIKANVLNESDQQRVLGVDLDVSDELEAQQKIQEMAENLQAVLDGSPAAIGLLKAIRDPEDGERIVDFQLAVGNCKLAQSFRKPLRKLLGQSAERLNKLLGGKATLDRLRQVRLTGEAYYDEQLLSDGRWLAIAVTYQDDGVLVTALDITELKTIQDQQQHWLAEVEASRDSVETLGDLRETLSQRSELLRAVSHDLRGNFGVISGALHLLNMATSED